VVHHSRLRIAGAHPRFALGFFSTLALLQLLQLLQCTLQPLLLLAPRAGLRLFHLRTGLFVPRVAHLFDALPRPLQVLPNRCFPLITPRTRQRFDFRAILHHLFQRNQPFLAQRRQNLREQLVQFFLSLYAKIRQRVVVHFLQPRQPLERRIVLAPPPHFPRRSNPLAVGIYPQTDQKLRIERRTPALFRAALNRLVKRAQLQTPH